MLTNGAFYRELGADYYTVYTVRKPPEAKARAVSLSRSTRSIDDGHLARCRT